MKTFADYWNTHTMTEEQERQLEEERQNIQANIEATKLRREGYEDAKKAHKDTIPTPEEVEAGKKLYKQITDGVNRGESPIKLLELSLQALRLFTKDTEANFKKYKEAMKVNYGLVDGNADALAFEMAEVEERIKRYETTLANPNLTYTEKEAIKKTLNANKKRLRDLQKQIGTPLL